MMCKLFCFLSIIVVNLFYYVANTAASPIINGIPDDQHHFKFHVSIHCREGPRTEFEQTCSGSIISERYILTAAHCFMNILNGEIDRVRYPCGTTKIIAGTNRRNGPGIERDCIRVFIPSEYDVYSHDNDRITVKADIAVAELSADLGVHQHPDRLAIIPLEVLDPRSNAGVHEQATLCGFGHDILVRQHNGQSHPGDSRTFINRFMNVKILGRDECTLFDISICARNSDNRIFRTSCFGDSGTALVYGNKLVGILSSGPPNCDTLLIPIVFTRLHGFMRFIEEAQNPRGDHSNMMILDVKREPTLRGRSYPRHRGGGSSSSRSAGGQKEFLDFLSEKL